jgi:hypothetical protein
MRPISCLIMALMVAISAFSSSAQSPWVTSWTGSVQGPYPIGNPRPSPICALPTAEEEGPFLMKIVVFGPFNS